MTSRSGYVTRRSALALASAAGAVLADGGVRFGRRAKAGNQATLHEGRHPHVTVAAVQMEAGQRTPAGVSDRMCAALERVHSYNRNVSLIAYPGGLFARLEHGDPAFQHLGQCARTLECALTFGVDVFVDARGTTWPRTSVLIDSAGQVHTAYQSKPLLWRAPFGGVAVVPEPLPAEHLHQFVKDGVSVLVTPGSYDVTKPSPLAMADCAGMTTVFVSPADPLSQRTDRASAIFDGHGQAVTCAGNRWNQIIVATLPAHSARTS